MREYHKRNAESTCDGKEVRAISKEPKVLVENKFIHEPGTVVKKPGASLNPVSSTKTPEEALQVTDVQHGVLRAQCFSDLERATYDKRLDSETSSTLQAKVKRLEAALQLATKNNQILQKEKEILQRENGVLKAQNFKNLEKINYLGNKHTLGTTQEVKSTNSSKPDNKSRQEVGYTPEFSHNSSERLQFLTANQSQPVKTGTRKERASIVQRDLQKYHATHRTLPNKFNSYKDEILIMSRAGESVQSISNHLFRNYNILQQPSGISKALISWDTRTSLTNSPTWRFLDAYATGQRLPHTPLPANLLLESELQVLKNAIKDSYFSSEIQFPKTLPAVLHDWTLILISAMCRDPDIHAIIIKEKLQPGYHWSERRVFNPLWLLGIQLPGSYRLEGVRTMEEIIEAVNSVTPQILREVQQRLMALLDDCISVAKNEDGDVFVHSALSLVPATTPPKCVMDILYLAHAEVVELRQDVKLKESLSGLLTLSEFSAGAKLHEYLKTEPAVHSVLREMTSTTTIGLQSWLPPNILLGQLPAITSSDFMLVLDEKRSQNNQLLDNYSEHEESEHEVQQELGTDCFQTPQARYKKLHSLLSARVNVMFPTETKVFCDWRAPTTGALSGSPPARFNAEPWEPDHNMLAKLLNIDRDGINKTQSLTDVCEHTLSNKKSPQMVQERLQDARQFLEDILANQTALERAEYHKICKRMGECTSRPSTSKFVRDNPAWSIYSRDDDWWHCRRLLQMLVYCGAIVEDAYITFEVRLLSLLAATEGGSSEVLIWIIALEGLLRELSEYIKQRNNNEDTSRSTISTQQELLRELCSFSHAVAMTNILLRFGLSHRPTKNPLRFNAPYTLQKWYTLLYMVDAHCAYPGCCGLLTSPREVKAGARSCFSVSVLYSRTGSRRARSFISGRKSIFWCPVTWLVYYEPTAPLIGLFIWYAEIFHPRGKYPCKESRGKWRQMF